jgi:hypothetical protein
MKNDDGKDRYDPAKLRAPPELLKTARVGPTPTSQAAGAIRTGAVDLG